MLYFSKRPSSTTTRIKTFKFTIIFFSASHVRDHLPLQQGLRHSTICTKHHRCLCTRPSSTTTRIKTLTAQLVHLTPLGSTRPSSTTTRIKTRTSLRSEPSTICTIPSSTTTRIKVVQSRLVFYSLFPYLY